MPERPEERLLRDHLLSRNEDGTLVPTRRWRGAVARAAHRLVTSGQLDGPAALPLCIAIVELYGDDIASEELATFVAVLMEADHHSRGAPPPVVSGSA